MSCVMPEGGLHRIRPLLIRLPLAVIAKQLGHRDTRMVERALSEESCLNPWKAGSSVSG